MGAAAPPDIGRRLRGCGMPKREHNAHAAFTSSSIIPRNIEVRASRSGELLVTLWAHQTLLYAPKERQQTVYTLQALVEVTE